MLRLISCAVIAGSLLGAPAPVRADDAAARRIGVYPLDRQGPADPAYDKLQEHLRRNLAMFPGTEAFELATPTKCKADDLDCLVNVGRMAQAEFVIFGTVERFTDGYAVRLQLVDVGSASRREVKRIIQGGGPDLVAAMELAACELASTERCLGTLRVGGPAGARVLLDGRDAGALPFSGPVSVGRHAVRIARAGFSTEERFASVSFHQETQLTVDMREGGLLTFADNDFDVVPLPPVPGESVVLPPPEPLAPPDPPAPAIVAALPPAAPPAAPAPAAAVAGEKPTSAAWLPTATLMSLAVGGILVTTGAVFGIGSELQAAEANRKFESRTLTAADRSLYDGARSGATIANVSFGLGAFGLATAAVLFLIDPTALSGGGGGGVVVGVSPAGVVATGSFE